MTKSIVSNDRHCYACGAPEPLHRHHVFSGVANRTVSEREGCWVYLCPQCHTGDQGVHFNHQFDQTLRKLTQTRWMWVKGRTIEDFRRVFGRSYLGEDEA